MGVFEGEHLAGDVLGLVLRIQCATGLKDDVPFVVNFVDVVDGHATFPLAGPPNRLVNVMAVHALASVTGQQSGVDIDDGPLEGPNQVLRNEPQKARQGNKVNGMLGQFGQNVLGVVKLLSLERQLGDALGSRQRQYASGRLVANDQADLNIAMLPEVSNNLGSITPPAGGKQGNFFRIAVDLGIAHKNEQFLGNAFSPLVFFC